MPSLAVAIQRTFLPHVLLRALLCALLCSLGALTSAQAAEFKVDLIQLDPWALVNTDKNSREPNVGIVVDLLREFEKRSGHRVKSTLAPYARVERDLEEGSIDFSIMAWGDARARYANRGAEFVPLDFGVRARKGVSIKSYEDLARITTSATRGLKIDPRFDADNALRKDMVLDYNTGVRKTALNRDSQAVAGSLSSINYLIGKYGLEQEFGETLVFRTTHLTVAYSKKSAHIALEAEVNAIFKTMTDDGASKSIYEKWMLNPRQH